MATPFIPVSNTASVELIYQAQGYAGENKLHVRKGSPYSFADLQALRAIFDNWDNTTGKALRHDAAQLVKIRSKALDSQGAAFEEFSLPAARGGTAGNNLLPLVVSFPIKLNTNNSGRSFRGRVYTFGLSSGVLGNGAGLVSVATANQFVAAYNTLIANLAAAGHTLCVVSLRSNHQWRAAGLVTPVVNAAFTSLALGTMRRRRTVGGQT